MSIKPEKQIDGKKLKISKYSTISSDQVSNHSTLVPVARAQLTRLPKSTQEVPKGSAATLLSVNKKLRGKSKGGLSARRR